MYGLMSLHKERNLKMPIETGNTISEFEITWPLSTDPQSEGDDHLRLIKSLLRAQFPGANGLGFEEAITATEAEINFLSGLTGNVQDQIDGLKTGLNAPAGTAIPFYNAAPPAGWAIQPATEDNMLRAVTVGGGTSGGSDSPISLSLAHTHTTADTVLTEAQMPVHNHGYKDRYYAERASDVAAATVKESMGGHNSGFGSGSTDLDNNTYLYLQATSDNKGGGGAHNHGATSSALTTWTPKYSNVIIGVKL
jgi:hypothetical protein